MTPCPWLIYSLAGGAGPRGLVHDDASSLQSRVVKSYRSYMELQCSDLTQLPSSQFTTIASEDQDQRLITTTGKTHIQACKSCDPWINYYVLTRPYSRMAASGHSTVRTLGLLRYGARSWCNRVIAATSIAREAPLCQEVRFVGQSTSKSRWHDQFSVCRHSVGSISNSRLNWRGGSSDKRGLINPRNPTAFLQGMKIIKLNLIAILSWDGLIIWGFTYTTDDVMTLCVIIIDVIVGYKKE